MKYPGSKLPSLFFKTLGKTEKDLYQKVNKRAIDDLIISRSPKKQDIFITKRKDIKALKSEQNLVQIDF